MSTVLVTCVGSGVGQSVVDSLGITSRDKIIGCDLDSCVYAYHYCHHFYKAPSIYSEEYIYFLLDICRKENVDLIIPGHDYELGLFSKNIQLFKDVDVEVIVSPNDLINISRDKFLWYEFFSCRGCSIVPTFRLEDFLNNPDLSIFPAILKPLGGSASQGIKIINSLADIKAKDSDCVIQPYLFPLKNDPNYSSILNAVKNDYFVQLSEISIQLIFSFNSTFEGIFISKNTLKNGVPITIDPINPKEFMHTNEIMKFVPILIEHKVKGPVNIQGRITESGLIFFEMNMRFTGITGNRAQLGFNEVQFLVNNFLGKHSQLNGFAPNKVGARQVACTTKPRDKKIGFYNKEVCILGGGSFIGSYVVRKILDENACNNLYLVCRSESYSQYQKYFGSEKRVKIVKEDDFLLENIYSRTDVLINFVGARANEDDDSIYNAIIFLFNQTQKIIKSNIPLIINISSQSVYNQLTDDVKTEQDKALVCNLYAFQKYLSEEYFRSIHYHSPDSKVISLRLSRVIGNSILGKKSSGFFSDIIEAFYTKNGVSITNPNNKINLIDVRDVSGAIFHIISQIPRDKLPEIMNIGGTNMSIHQFCKYVSESLKIDISDTNIAIERNNNITISSMVSTQSLNSLNWFPEYSINETILWMAQKNRHINEFFSL